MYCMFRSRNLWSLTSLMSVLASRSTAIPRHHGFHNSEQGRQSIWLSKRAVIRLAGRDTVDLLQGLVTSNVVEMTDGYGLIVQYAMMLNVQGRVLYDLILYNQSRVLTEVCFLVECDASLKEEFIKTIKTFRIRKKVDITDVSDEYKVWSRINTDCDPSQPLLALHQGEGGVGHGVKQDMTVAKDMPNMVFCVEDPRVPLFGHRLILTSGNESGNGNSDFYDQLRYQWGIPEGPKDLPPGNCLPLESNLTIMNGVSFTKGCYIGQELTARTHHTGVIRKRLLPLVFESDPPELDNDAPIISEKSQKAGKLRANIGKYGLGIIRLDHDRKSLNISDRNGNQIPVSAYRPGWWPEDLRT